MTAAIGITTRPSVSRGPRQLASHHHLHCTPPAALLSGRTRSDVPDAIIVPSTRPASRLAPLIDIAADLGTELVVLCSRSTAVDYIAERIERRVRGRGVVACVDDVDSLAGPTLQTSSTWFATANARRHSDLSAKRNLGLRLARTRGWSKIVFIDDDMSLDAVDVTGIGRLLDRFPIAGMRSRTFRDNSVVCHARHLSGQWQDVFTSGAVLGVDCDSPDLGFFPDIYNEDWFFFGGAVTTGQLPNPLDAAQAEYDPYADPDRARREEFGDLLAEGLYALIEHDREGGFEGVCKRANTSYWGDFIDARIKEIDRASARLDRIMSSPSCADQVGPALDSLAASKAMYDEAITADRCVEFLQAWSWDTAHWRSELPAWSPTADTAAALVELGVRNPVPVRPGQGSIVSRSLAS